MDDNKRVIEQSTIGKHVQPFAMVQPDGPSSALTPSAILLQTFRNPPKSSKTAWLTLED